MAVQKLSSKNQIVIPKEARQAMIALLYEGFVHDLAGLFLTLVQFD